MECLNPKTLSPTCRPLFRYPSMYSREVVTHCPGCQADIITQGTTESTFMKPEMRNRLILRLGRNPFMRAVSRRPDLKPLKVTFNLLRSQSTPSVLRDQVSTDPWRPLECK